MNTFSDLISNLKPDQLHIKVQETGEQWTVIEVLRHIAYSEEMIVDLINDIVEGGQGADEGVSLPALNQVTLEHTRDTTIEDIMNQMQKSRDMTINLLDTLQPDDWKKQGRYFTGDIMTIGRIFEILIWHQAHHTKKIKEKLERQQIY